MEERAFTLIELLTVIAIIGVLAALVIPLSGVASSKMRLSRVNVELNNYITAIESYKSRLNYYPPDNPKVKSLVPADYRLATGMNPLFYELSGAIYTNLPAPNGAFTTLNGSEKVSTDDLLSNFGVKGVQNSARDPRDVPYKGAAFKPAQYAALNVGTDVEVLAVPVPQGPDLLTGKAGKINPWRYDASSLNRHNRDGFDLWAEYTIGKKTIVIGNWKQ